MKSKVYEIVSDTDWGKPYEVINIKSRSKNKPPKGLRIIRLQVQLYPSSSAAQRPMFDCYAYSTSDLDGEVCYIVDVRYKNCFDKHADAGTVRQHWKFYQDGFDQWIWKMEHYKTNKYDSANHWDWSYEGVDNMEHAYVDTHNADNHLLYMRAPVMRALRDACAEAGHLYDRRDESDEVVTDDDNL